MTNTKLIEDNSEKEITPRTNFIVEIQVESKLESILIAKVLREAVLERKLIGSGEWANDLAAIFEGN